MEWHLWLLKEHTLTKRLTLISHRKKESLITMSRCMLNLPQPPSKADLKHTLSWVWHVLMVSWYHAVLNDSMQGWWVCIWGHAEHTPERGFGRAGRNGHKHTKYVRWVLADTMEWGQTSKGVFFPVTGSSGNYKCLFTLLWPVWLRESSYRKALPPCSHTQGLAIGNGLLMNWKGVSLQWISSYHGNSHCVFYIWRFKESLKILKEFLQHFISIHITHTLKNPYS